jgi:hypothetical protein
MPRELDPDRAGNHAPSLQRTNQQGSASTSGDSQTSLPSPSPSVPVTAAKGTLRASTPGDPMFIADTNADARRLLQRLPLEMGLSRKTSPAQVPGGINIQATAMAVPPNITTINGQLLSRCSSRA